MKLLTNFFASAATKFPKSTIIVILIITGMFGYMTTQAEELDTGFGGELDTPEIEAQGKLIYLGLLFQEYLALHQSLYLTLQPE